MDAFEARIISKLQIRKGIYSALLRKNGTIVERIHDEIRDTAFAGLRGLKIITTYKEFLNSYDHFTDLGYGFYWIHPYIFIDW